MKHPPLSRAMCLPLLGAVRLPKPGEVACVLLPLCSIALWSLALKNIHIGQMNDLGLVSVLPPSVIIAPSILAVSFYLSLQLHPRPYILLLHVVLLIFMLYGITTLVEAAPHLAITYKDAGYTEYIMRNGTVDPGLDFYFNFPSFFIISAFVTRIAGYHDILSFAAWSPVFFNLIYLAPIYMIFSSATTNKRHVWLGMWFFCATDWIEQDSFAPQSLNFFLYLVIIAILLTWFKVSPQEQSGIGGRLRRRLERFLPFTRRLSSWLAVPDTLYSPIQTRQRVLLLIAIVLIFALIVSSHPLTPFFTLASVTALVIFRRCRPSWLPIVMAVMTGAWIFFMTQSFLVGHLAGLLSDFGHIGSAITQNVAARATQGNPEHDFVARMRIIMTLFVWGLAFVGAILRLRRGHHDLTFLLLAVAPFSLILLNSYGGEMVLRIYLFALPFMAFFAAGLFYSAPTFRIPLRLMITLVSVSCILLGGFLFTRYGNERVDYMTTDEINAIHYLYSIAPPNALFLSSEDNGTLQYQDYEKYSIDSLANLLPDALITKNVHAIVQYIASQKNPQTYLIFTRSQKAWAYELAGVPSGTLEQLEDALLKSGKFQMIYNNSDAQIFIYLH